MALFESTVEFSTIAHIFSTIFRQLMKTGSLARFSHACIIRIAVFAFSSISPTVLEIKKDKSNAVYKTQNYDTHK